jgi:rhodanese-related sulfurtransferase/DNA-binding transcriptional ArsR family regulator
MQVEPNLAFKRKIYDQFARIGKALSSGPRIELLDLLSQTERTVEQLVQETRLSFANVSQHLQVLRRARLVEVRREGLHAYYRLADESVFEVWKALRATGERRLLEIKDVVQSYLKNRENMEPVTAEELVRRMDQESVVVLDVRPTEEYLAGHIPGAISLPVGQLKRRMKELPQDRQIVAYCRGPYCVQADTAVDLLNRNGFEARRLEVGLPDWRDLGLPVKRGVPAGSSQRSHRGRKSRITHE